MLAAGSSRSVAAWSVAAYAVVTLAWLCYVAYEWAHGGTETMLHAGVNVIAALVLPALTGFGVGRWWAFLLASWLIPAALLAQMLEPPFERSAAAGGRGRQQARAQTARPALTCVRNV